MVDGVHRLSGLPDSATADGRAPADLSQASINALPSIMGPVADPDSDSSARVDRAGYVYLWEPAEGIGFWVQAGYLRNGRPRFGQVIDPNDIQWFNLDVFRKKLLRAKKRLNTVRMPGHGDGWNVAREDENCEARAYRQSDDDDSIGSTYHAGGDCETDTDIDIV